MEFSRKDKRKIQVEQQVFHILLDIVELYPQYSLSQHLCHILRKKEESKEAYFWSDEVLLKKFEDYYDELKQDLSN
jgi:hypothetical protein